MLVLYHLYKHFASYVRRVLHKTRLISSRINGPIVHRLKVNFQICVLFVPLKSSLKIRFPCSSLPRTLKKFRLLKNKIKLRTFETQSVLFSHLPDEIAEIKLHEILPRQIREINNPRNSVPIRQKTQSFIQGAKRLFVLGTNRPWNEITVDRNTPSKLDKVT